ncbi:MAG: MltA domain-containing protein [Phycisphaerales bacterium]|jgi:membrane-bound lytic murein transglycosylase A
MKRKILLSALLLIAVFVIIGCKSEMREVEAPYDSRLLPGEPALRKITNSYEVPDFTMACFDLTDLRKAITNSQDYLRKPSSQGFFPCRYSSNDQAGGGEITHSQALNSLNAFAALLDRGLTGKQLDEAVRAKFDVYMSVGCDGIGTVLFTGYYTPIFDGSLSQKGHYNYPLYRTPDDLVKDATGEILGRRSRNGNIRPYPPRSMIEDLDMLEGMELVWLSDPFEAYIAHVQGSAKIRLPDGKVITVGYDASNGHEYRSVAKELVRDGRISPEQVNLSAMIAFFKRNKDLVDVYVRRNPRFVFFKKEMGEPRGSLNEPVIPYRSIATDKSIFPRGCLAFISTYLPKVKDSTGSLGTTSTIANQLYSGFALDQDTGGAIRAAGRCDVYMGQGEMAGELAGQTYQEGRLYYLFLK